MRVPFPCPGIDPKKHRKLQFNVSVRESAAPLWQVWEGPRGYSWAVQNAGTIVLP